MPSVPFVDDEDIYDVAVLGGGNAGLCAALTAREAGARVIVVESAPRHFRGGNSRHTRNLRCMHTGPSHLLTDSYSEDEFCLRPASGQRAVRPTKRSRVSSFADRQAVPNGCGDSVSVFNRPCAARCIWLAPTPSFWAAARRS